MPAPLDPHTHFYERQTATVQITMPAPREPHTKNHVTTTDDVIVTWKKIKLCTSGYRFFQTSIRASVSILSMS